MLSAGFRKTRVLFLKKPNPVGFLVLLGFWVLLVFWVFFGQAVIDDVMTPLMSRTGSLVDLKNCIESMTDNF